jgi:hypothetical protein
LEEMATTVDDVEQSQTTTRISGKMKARGTLPDIKHRHHVGSFDTKVGVFDFLRSLLSPPAHTFEVTLAIVRFKLRRGMTRLTDLLSECG